ncbi:MAG: hypothetical protein ACI32O_07190 [Enterococcus sp.]
MEEGKDILLYGLLRERVQFFNKLKNEEINLGEKTFKIDKKHTSDSFHSYSIDIYTKRFEEIIKNRDLKNPEQWHKFSQDWLNDIPIRYKTLPLWEAFYRYMEITPKNQEKLMEDPIKQGCKRGIDMAIDHPKMMIYFVLDGIDMEPVTTKSKSCEPSYTGSELRYVYRRWSEAKEKIAFFKEDKEVKAPWIKGLYINDWEKYGNHRTYRRLGGKMRKAIEERKHESFEGLNEYKEKARRHWELSKLATKTSTVHPKKLQNTRLTTFEEVEGNKKEQLGLSKLTTKTSDIHPKKLQNTQLTTAQKHEEKTFRSFKTLSEWGNKKASVNNCKKKQLKNYFELSI